MRAPFPQCKPRMWQHMAHLIALLDRHGAPHPQPDATHYSGQIGRHWIKWEQHTEFVTYTAFTSGLSERPFDPDEFDVFPQDWLDAASGVRVTSILLRIAERPSDKDINAQLNDWFVPESLAVSRVLGDDAVVAGDFRIDNAGHLRFAIFAGDDTGKRRVGRIVQRLCEIETYKSMSMLGFARARTMGAQLNDEDARLTALMGRMAGAGVRAEETLDQLLSISAELEKQCADVSFRFGATGAYEAIVNQRITALREERFKGRQRTCCGHGWMWNARPRTRRCWKAWTNARTCNCASSARLRGCRWWRSATTRSRWRPI